MARYESSKNQIAGWNMLHSADEINRIYNHTDEWKRLCERHPSVANIAAAEDISSWLNFLEIENYFFNEEEFLIIVSVFQACSAFYPILRKNSEALPLLSKIAGSGAESKAVTELIYSKIDPKGKLLPYASVAYGKISAELEKLERDARSITQKLFKQWKDAGYTAETDITVRDERLVIPLLAENKRKVSGFVKDISATGKVIYIEPQESLELNNRITELHLEKRREREKILIALTENLREHKAVLQSSMEVLTKLDLIKVRADFASRLKANRPVIDKHSGIVLKNAVNPVLWLKNREQNRKTVPMSLQMDHNNRIVIISGPNAGGKSIVLKAVALLQYMAQFGLYITADSESKLGIFKNISIDCGDGQSINDGLSTFSAHLQHLKKMTAIASPASFFAIDELGDGTDPRFGGPIAQAILENLLKSGAYGVVTTHYSRLKEWANHTEGVVNASMAYDNRELKPLYELTMGKPGSSFALELMKKTGFEDSVIQKVKKLSGEESGKTEDLLMDLSARQLELNELIDENRNKEKQLELLLKEYHALKDKISERKKEIIEAAKQSAAELLKGANKQIELTIKTIKEHGANPEKTKMARKELEQFSRKKALKLEGPKMKNAPPKSPGVKKNIIYAPGMQVRNTLNDAVGEVIEVKKDKVLGAFGLIKMWVSLDEIEPAETSTSIRKPARTGGFNWVERQSVFKTELDLRGARAEDALKMVEQWMDEAYALGQNQLKIIHGRGDGVLRKMLRGHFKTVSFIKSWKSELESKGGDGCTIIELF